MEISRAKLSRMAAQFNYEEVSLIYINSKIHACFLVGLEQETSCQKQAQSSNTSIGRSHAASQHGQTPGLLSYSASTYYYTPKSGTIRQGLSQHGLLSSSDDMAV